MKDLPFPEIELEKALERYDEIQRELSSLYVEREKLASNIIDLYLTDKEKYANLGSEWFNYDFIFSNKHFIDYEKLERDYPHIYVLGLQPSFSKNVLLKSIDSKTANLILKECTYSDNKYKIKRTRKKYKKKVVDDNEQTNNT